MRLWRSIKRLKMVIRMHRMMAAATPNTMAMYVCSQEEEEEGTPTVIWYWYPLFTLRATAMAKTCKPKRQPKQPDKYDRAKQGSQTGSWPKEVRGHALHLSHP